MPGSGQLGPAGRFRTVWISAIHLGTPGCTPGCKVDVLLDFLKNVHCQTLDVVGDIVDC
jgi:UDP-2,3-diacylglucosamine pyrophosphatase LpxH